MAAYSIILHTQHDGGDVQPAAEVFLTLFGTKASSHELALGNEATPTAGQPEIDQGELVDLGDIDLGDIRRVRVRHDDPGVGPGYRLDRVVVRATGTLQEWTFHCGRWLARHQGHGPTEQTLDVVPVAL